jgi:hypothetical protein
MDRADETVYPAGVSGLPRVILWVKFSPWGGEVHYSLFLPVFFFWQRIGKQ